MFYSIKLGNLNPPPLKSDDPAKPFKCSICSKNLASKNVYQLHLRSHSGEKPFSCEICQSRFSQKTSLTRHIRSHTGERPFPCEVCFELNFNLEFNFRFYFVGAVSPNHRFARKHLPTRKELKSICVFTLVRSHSPAKYAGKTFLRYWN